MGNKIDIVVSAIDRVTAPLRRINKAVHNFTAPVARVNGALSALYKESGMGRIINDAGKFGGAMSNVGKEASALAAKLTLLGGGAAWLFKSQLIDTAAEFERYRTILETVEGSSEKAQKSMDWVSDFAAKTPFEMGEVTDAFVKLKAYGLDPVNGLLRTLGDTGSAMGKSIIMAVEAMADAVTGEYERLKEFGVKASTKGNRVTFAFTDKDGKQQAKTVDNRNRAMIQSTLEAIWNEKYAGAMEKQSGTWIGMISNLMDQWTRFKLMIMKSGVFSWLSDKLKGFLDKIDKMAADGTLQKWADDIGKKIKDGMEMAWEGIKKLFGAIKEIGGAIAWLADMVGGYKNLLLIVAAIMAGKLIAAILGAAAALKTLGISFAMTPLGWFMIAVAAIAGLVYLIYKNWGPITKFFSGLWEGVKGAFNSAVDWITGKFKSLLDWVRGAIIQVADLMPDWMKKYTLPGIAISKMADSVRPTGAPVASPAGGQRNDVGGTIHVKIDSEGRPRVAKADSKNRNVGYDVDAGYTMVMP